jgi:uncharacterized protein
MLIYAMTNINKTILFLIFLVLLSSNSFAGGIFWEVKSKNNNKATVYLLGSIHMATDELYPMPKEIDAAFSNSDYLVLELDISKINPIEMQKKMMLEDGKTIDNLLSESLIDKLETEFSNVGMKKSEWMRFRPWSAILILTQKILIRDGLSPDLGIDFHYLMETIKDGQEVLELESFELQMETFARLDSFPDSYIDYSLESLHEGKKMVDQMIKAWKIGDTLSISKILWDEESQKIEGYDELLKIMLDERNVGMTNKIEEYLNTNKTYFVIVGAGHLLGEKGILQLLVNTKKYNILKK